MFLSISASLAFLALACSLFAGITPLLRGSLFGHFPLCTREESFVRGFVSGFLSELLFEVFEAARYVNKKLGLGLSLGLLLSVLCSLFLPVVPTLLESCIKLCVFIILVSFATATGRSGCRRATTDEVRIILLAVLVALVLHHLGY